MEAKGFPAWLARQLGTKQWTAADFARESGFSPGMVSNWLRGRRVPSPESIDRIADVLNADVAMVMQLAGHLPAVEPIDPDSPAERLVAKIRRVKPSPEAIDYLDAALDTFLKHRRAEAERRRTGEGGGA